MHKRHNQSGAVSLFIVVFTALLITVVTVSFVRIMVRDQQQASTVDLSQSAYDSAQAGLEDAKRAILRYQSVCENEDAAACDAARAKLDSDECNVALEDVVPVATDTEIKVQQTINDTASSLDQAYTCVKIELETSDYVGTLQANSSKMVPITSNSAFNTVLLEWYTSDDLQAADGFSVDLLPGSSTTQPLLAQDSWQPNRPSIMRTQLIQFGDSFRLTDFDDTTSGGESNANTLFLYPTGVSGTALPDSATPDSKSFVGRDQRKTPVGSLQPVTCSGDLTQGGYACRVELRLPTPVGGGDRTAYMRVAALYNKTNYRLTLSNNGTDPALFDSVQPKIDSTGRANDLFRRVQSRIEIGDTTFAYPDATVDITGNFCKNFLITDDTDDYENTCTP